MTDQQRLEEEIFYQAIEKKPGEERDAFIEEACASDIVLRHAVIGLLDAYFEPVSVLDDTVRVFSSVETAESGSTKNELAEKPGDEIGRYKLLQRIGEGGFGSVWMAEQTRPITRRVALKIIKLGMDTKEVIARFEAERQALALMDHPNIAKILDAGATPEGRPYFAMELVKGIPINRFCDERKMNTRARLELFVEVCGAVTHAHQKGLIHRDLKPTNILVTLIGDRPVPKIIDFGIAKATQAKLTEKTLFTRFEQFVGTPIYMSPEQAVLSGLDIDTRSDIYSLGVLLYELITGKLPFDPETLREKDFDELRRIIREEDPPRPSNRLGTLQGNDRTAVAETHQGDPQRLHRLVKNDLDWVVMKAIEKDRTRRYETANAFALDIKRFLNEEPVTAAAPTTIYRLKKFTGRNKGLVAAVSAVAVALVMGTSISMWQMFEAKRHAQTALDNQQKAHQAQTIAENAKSRAETERDNVKAANKVIAEQQIELAEANRRLKEQILEKERIDNYFIDDAESFTLVMRRLKEYPAPAAIVRPEILKFGIRASSSAWDVYKEVKWILQPVRSALERKLGSTVVVKIVVYRDYLKLLNALGNNEIDFVRCGANPYILGKTKFDKLKLVARHDAQDENAKGEIIDKPGRIIIRKDLSESHQIKSLGDLRDYIEASAHPQPIRVAFGSPYSGSGRIRIQEMLRRSGIIAEMVDWKHYPRHKDVAEAVAESRAEVGGIKFPTFEKYFLGVHDAPPRKPDGAVQLAEYDYSPHQSLTPEEQEKGGKGKPWVASEDFASRSVADENLFTALQDALVNLTLPSYQEYWRDTAIEAGSDGKLKSAPDRDYPLPIVTVADDFYGKTRSVNRDARGFFKTLPDRILKQDEFRSDLKEASPEVRSRVRDRVETVLDELDLLDTLSYTILAIENYRHNESSIESMAEELGLEPFEVREKRREAMATIRAAVRQELTQG